jgi:hypothetical protein
MAVLSDKKIVGAPFRNEGKVVRVVYDFAQDGGAIADYDAIVADGAILVELLSIDCKTALTATATSNMDLGKNAGGVEFLSAFDAGGGISADVQTPGDTAGMVVELADGEKIVMGVDTAAITAGKLEFIFKVYSR